MFLAFIRPSTASGSASDRLAMNTSSGEPPGGGGSGRGAACPAPSWCAGGGGAGGGGSVDCCGCGCGGGGGGKGCGGCGRADGGPRKRGGGRGAAFAPGASGNGTTDVLGGGTAGGGILFVGVTVLMCRVNVSTSFSPNTACTSPTSPGKFTTRILCARQHLSYASAAAKAVLNVPI